MLVNLALFFLLLNTCESLTYVVFKINFFIPMS